MKVLMIAFARGAAVAYYVSQLSNALSGTESVAVIIPDNARVKSSSGQVRTIGFSSPSNLFGVMLQVFNPFLHRSLARKVSHTNPDVVHIVFEARFPFSFAWLLHRKYPVVTTIHEPKPLSTEGIATILLSPIQVINSKLRINFSDKVIVHGERHRRDMIGRRVPEHKIKVIPHGAFSFLAHCQKSGVKISKDNVLFFGRIVQYKGLKYLIEAGKLIKQRIPDLTITIAGQGEFAKYKKLIGNDETFVVLNRFIPDEEAAELFQKASIVVLPYSHGSQSGTISIAGSFKKPVIVTDVGNFSEMVDDRKTGFVIPPRDVNALADAIIKLLTDDELRQEMGENACNMVAEKFNWNNIALKTLGVYKDAITVWHQNLKNDNLE